jgi:hypothetical protein
MISPGAQLLMVLFSFSWEESIHSPIGLMDASVYALILATGQRLWSVIMATPASRW